MTARSEYKRYYYKNNFKHSTTLFGRKMANPTSHRNSALQCSKKMVAPRICNTFGSHNILIHGRACSATAWLSRGMDGLHGDDVRRHSGARSSSSHHLIVIIPRRQEKRWVRVAMKYWHSLSPWIAKQMVWSRYVYKPRSASLQLQGGVTLDLQCLCDIITREYSRSFQLTNHHRTPEW